MINFMNIISLFFNISFQFVRRDIEDNKKISFFLF